jgi:hypothetical protein
MALSFPPNPAQGDIYAYNGKTWKWDGYSWVAVSAPSATSAPVYVGVSPPPSPIQGSLWYSLLDNSLNVYCIDLNGGQWVAAVPYPLDGITQQGGIFEGAIYSEYEIPNNSSAFVTVGWVEAIVNPLIVQINALQWQLDDLQSDFNNYVSTHP